MENFFSKLYQLEKEGWQKIQEGAFWKHVFEYGIDFELYTSLMSQIFHYSKHKVQNQALVATNIFSDRLDLLRFYLNHSLEEAGRDLMIVNDLKKMGMQPIEVLNSKPLPETEELITYLYDVSSEKDPVAHLGYRYWAEGSYSYLRDLLVKIQKSLCLADEDMSFFKHLSLDTHQFEQVRKMLWKYSQKPSLQEEVKGVLKTSLSLIGNTIDASFAQYAQKSRKTFLLSSAGAYEGGVIPVSEAIDLLRSTIEYTGQAVENTFSKYLQQLRQNNLAKEARSYPVSKRPQFSETLEDYATVGGALQLTEGDTLVSVASAGDTVFNSVLENGRRVLALDEQLDQVNFCRLKQEILSQASWDDAMILFGIIPSFDLERRMLFNQLTLHQDLNIYREASFAKELSCCGLLEMGEASILLRRIKSEVLQTIPQAQFERILNTAGKQERESIWNLYFNRREVIDAISRCLHNSSATLIFSKQLEKPVHFYFFNILKRQLVECSPIDNYFAHRFWLGHFKNSQKLPPYLQKKNFERLRAGLKRISWFNENLLTFLKNREAESVQAFNLGSYTDDLDDAAYEEVWREIHRVASYNGKVFLQSFAEVPRRAEFQQAWRFAYEKSKIWKLRDKLGFHSSYQLWEKT